MSTRLLRKCTTLPGQLFVAVAYAYFLSGADNYIYRYTGIALAPNTAFIFFFIPLLLLIFIADLMRGKPLSGLFSLFRANAWVLTTFFIVVGCSLLYSLHTTAYWEEDGKWIKIYAVDFGVFLVGLCLPMLKSVRSGYRRYFLLGSAVLLASLYYDMFFPGQLFNSKARAAGLAVNANLAGFSLVLMAAASLGYEVRTRRIDNWILALSGLGVFATLSRGSVLLYVLLLGYYFYAVLFGARGGLKKGAMIVFSGGVLLVFLALMIPYLIGQTEMFAKQGAQRRLGQIMGNRGLYNQEDSRVQAASKSLGLIDDSPFFGHGTGYSQSMVVGPHNMYLKQWVDNGLPGLLAYIALLVSSFWLFNRRRFFPGQGFILVAALGGFFSHNVLDLRPFLLLFGTLVGVSWYQSLRRPGGVEFLGFITATQRNDRSNGIAAAAMPAGRFESASQAYF